MSDSIGDLVKLVEEQALERRERILQTVRECIAEQGVLELTIRDLAKACRVSVPTLYRGFGGKEELLVEAIRSFFNSDVLGEKLESTGLAGGKKILAVIDLCGQTMEDMPEYNQQLFTLFMNSDYGAQLGWDITESITLAVRQGLLEVKQENELANWVDADVLAERVAAQCIVAVLEFCNGDLSIESFVNVFGYSTCLMLAGATSGKTQRLMLRRVKTAQTNARRQGNTRLDRSPGKIGA